MFCVSCRTRKTLSRCKRKAIKGLQYCGTHARAKTKRIWTILNGCDSKALKIQKVWRGFAIRNRLSKLGPGVMKRSLCHNDEELVTLEPINKLNPFLYFAFEENNKVWAFDIHTLTQVLLRDIVPQNPYTRTPLTFDTRRRLRKYMQNMIRRRDPLYSAVSMKHATQYHLNQLTQSLHENGFDDFRPEYFSVLTPSQAVIMRTLICRDMMILANRHSNFSRRHRYVAILKNKNFMSNADRRTCLLSILMIILSDIWCVSEEYEFCFLIMSALYRI
jgi:hypothetical protein